MADGVAYRPTPLLLHSRAVSRREATWVPTVSQFEGHWPSCCTESETRPTIWTAVTVLQWCDVIVGWKVQQITASLCRWCYNELSRPSISRLDRRRCSRGCWEFDSSAVVVMAEAAGAAGSCWCRGTMPEPPAALLHFFSIGHKLTPPTNPTQHSHPPHTHTHTLGQPCLCLACPHTSVMHGSVGTDRLLLLPVQPALQ